MTFFSIGTAITIYYQDTLKNVEVYKNMWTKYNTILIIYPFIKKQGIFLFKNL